MDGPLGLNQETLLAEWARRVRANNEQAERFREATERPDFYAPIATSFKADPRRTDEPALDYLRGLVTPGETWVDIGADGGRYALPLALAGGSVIAVDPSAGMLAVLEAARREFGVEGIRTIEGRWPLTELPTADVALIAHVSYDIAEIGPFLEAMERTARRLCVAVLLAESPATTAAALWPRVHGEARHLLPALPEFLALLLSRGKLPGVWLGERGPAGYPSREAIESFAAMQLFIEPNGTKAEAMRAAIRETTFERDGKVFFSTTPMVLGVVTWKP